ncbi:MAG TPA: hypothetical protein VIY08_03445 [Candidatus Nitrosocosmicus sp.]
MSLFEMSEDKVNAFFYFGYYFCIMIDNLQDYTYNISLKNHSSLLIIEFNIDAGSWDVKTIKDFHISSGMDYR